MKKLFSVILSLAAILICGAIPASAWSAGINDMAKLYSPEEIARLEARQEEVAELTGWNIAVVTTEVGFGLDGVDACDFAEQFCYATFGDDPDSVVYLIDLDYRWISMDGDLLNHFNSSRFDTMMDACENHYQNYEDVENLEKFYYYLEYYYNAGTVEYDPTVGALGSDFEDSIEYYDDYGSDAVAETVGGFLLMGIIISVVAVAIVIFRYKFNYAPSANYYLNKSSVVIYQQEDHFVREYTTRTRIESSSGGSHRSGGSRRSGGRSRGGGGRGGRR